MWMILIDLVMKCFLPTSGSRYISLPHLHSEVLDSSTRPVTRWPSVLGWVIYPLWILVSYLSDLLCLPHGDAELIKWDNGVRMLWTGKITEAKWKRIKKKSSQDWPKQNESQMALPSASCFLYLLWPFFLSHFHGCEQRGLLFRGGHHDNGSEATQVHKAWVQRWDLRQVTQTLWIQFIHLYKRHSNSLC